MSEDNCNKVQPIDLDYRPSEYVKELASNLVASYRNIGAISHSQINDGLSDLGTDGNIVESRKGIDYILFSLEESGIDVVEDSKIKERVALLKKSRALAEKDGGDDFQVYRDSIGQNPLLTRSEEVRVAKEIEETGMAYARLVLSSLYGASEVYSAMCNGWSEKSGLDGDELEVRVADAKSIETRNQKTMKNLYGKRVSGVRAERYRANIQRNLRRAAKLMLNGIAWNESHNYKLLDRIREEYAGAVARLREYQGVMNNGAVQKVKDLAGAKALEIEKEFGWDLLQRYEQMEKVHQAWSDAKHTLSMRNRGLVIKNALKKMGLGVPVMDLIMAGETGLMLAVSRYDYRIARFSTYATHNIKGAIQVALRTEKDARTVKFTGHAAKNVKDIINARRDIGHELMRQPHDDEVAERLGVDVREVMMFESAGKMHYASLDKEIGDGDGATFGDLMEDPKATMPTRALYYTLLEETVDRVLKAAVWSGGRLNGRYTHPTRDLEMTKLRYGLKGGDAHTFQQLAHIFNYKGRALPQLVDRRIKELLKHPRWARKLEQFLPAYRGQRKKVARVNVTTGTTSA
ncbi:sigma-70 domain-containing protein [Nanoarchaeota archaeon]